MDSLVDVIRILLWLVWLAIFARVLVSWIAPVGRGGSNNPIVNVIYQVTEPILAPLRQIIPRLGLFDFTPMIAMIIITVIISILETD